MTTHSSHKMRYTDSSAGDEICDNCMQLDFTNRTNPKLEAPCEFDSGQILGSVISALSLAAADPIEPCPFCGDEMETDIAGDIIRHKHQGDCVIGTSGFISREKWNRRFGKPADHQQATKDMIFEAIRFANWAAGEGIVPVKEQPARSPGEFLMDYAEATGDEDFETIAERMRAKVQLK